MSVIGRLEQEVRDAMRARDDRRRDALRLILASLRSAEKELQRPLSEDELERIVDDAIAENGATSLRDMGRVMADVMPQVAGRADGSAVGQLVREKLA